ncbi:MAG: outer membrane beta-barrel protein [candidate division Zixibacteria bacterium]|nr:outer membrane beta-barrel protein [candidate division Zixibacteria bacterium]
MGKRLFLSFALTILLVTSAVAQNAAKVEHSGFGWKHQAGLRLGVWGNLGNLPPASDTSGLSKYEADIKDASFYFETYFAYRFHPAIMAELSVGIVNRGDVTVEETSGGYTDTYYGNLTVYPVQLRAKIYPFAGTSGKLFPYLTGGVAVYHGRHDIQFSTDPFFISENARTSFSYTIGGGIDYAVANQVGLDLNVTFLPINFSQDLFFVKDYQALTFTVGVKYLFQAPGKQASK